MAREEHVLDVMIALTTCNRGICTGKSREKKSLCVEKGVLAQYRKGRKRPAAE